MKSLKLLIFILGFMTLAQSSVACGIDGQIDELKFAESLEEKEDILYGMSSSLLFCGPAAYAKAVKATFDYTDFGPFFLKSYLFQYKQYYPNSFSIGNEWNRKEFEELNKRDLSKYIFRVGTATGVFLGKYKGSSLVATNRHVIESEECASLVVSDVKGTSYNCLKIINPKSKLDYAFVVVNEEIDLTPIQITTNLEKKGTPLLTGGRGYFLNDDQLFKEESSELCQLFGKDDLGQSMGCDSSPGDSGSPVFLRSSNKLYGLANSTGNTILDFSNKEMIEMLKDERYEKLIELQSSHLVPFSDIVNDNSNNEEVNDILLCLKTNGCLK